jgi:hypothetical protein
MKINFLFILMILGNLSYASFPVNNNEIVLISENIEVPTYTEEKKIWGNLSFYSSILSLLVLPNFISLVLSILSIVFGIIGLTRKVNWKVVTGLIIGLISAVIFALFFALIILSGGTGAAFGG